MTEEPKIKLPDEFDSALMGHDWKGNRAVYSIEGILETLMETQEWTLEECIEHFDHNIACAYMGEMTPLYVWTAPEGIDEWLHSS